MSKIKATVTINMGLYMDVRPEIIIDTENYDEAVELIRELHKKFYKLLEYNSPNNVRKIKNNQAKNEYETETEIESESELEGFVPKY